MRINGRQRLELEPNLKDFNQWPFIDVNDLPTNKRKGFLRNRKIMMLVLSGISQVKAARRCGVHPTFISYLLNRCLGGVPERTPALTSGLVPSNIVKSVTRKLPISTNCDSGARGSFTAILLEHPDITEHLDDLIRKFIRRDRRAENLRPGRFHREFLRILRERNWPENRYPFDQLGQGRESCRKYFHQRVQALRLPKPSEKKTRVVLPKSKYAYEEVQIDAWTADLTTSIDIYVGDDLIPIGLSRFTVYLATDAATGCRLSYHIALTAHPCKEDVLAVIEKIHLPIERNITARGLQSLPGAAFPSQLGKIYEHAGIQMIRLDNALAHHAGAVREYVCNELGATLNLGIPGQPKARGAVEYAFKELAALAARFPSATGNHPTHPIKCVGKNAKLPPVTKFHEFEDVLHSSLASFNVTNRQISAGSTPLDLVRYQMEYGYLPLSFSGIGKKRSAFMATKNCSVKFLKNERRAPFINFQTLRYSGRCLNSAKLLDRKIKVEYDVRDIRSIRAYTLEGSYLGELKAPMTRQHFPLSIQTFKKIRARCRDSGATVAGTVDGYMLELARDTNSSKSNLELVRVARELQFSLTGNRKDEEPTTEPRKITQTIGRTNTRKIVSWLQKTPSRREAS